MVWIAGRDGPKVCARLVVIELFGEMVPAKDRLVGLLYGASPG